MSLHHEDISPPEALGHISADCEGQARAGEELATGTALELDHAQAGDDIGAG